MRVRHEVTIEDGQAHMPHAARFWRQMKRYHDLAEQYQRGIDRTHPPSVTSNGVGHPYAKHSVWCATAVTYYKYNGPQI